MPLPTSLLSLGLAWALGPLSFAEISAAPPEAGYRVVRKDGSVVLFVATPREKGGTLVGTLWPDGPLVSIPRRDVDEARTQAANRAGPSPTPIPTATPRTVPLRTSRQEAERRLQEASGTGRPEELPERAEVGEGPRRRRKPTPDVPLEYRDFDGNGEEYWRTRARSVRARRQQAEDFLRRAEEEVERVDRSNPPGGGPALETWARDLQYARNQAEQARARLAVARQAEDELEDEARKARALPGWLR